MRGGTKVSIKNYIFIFLGTRAPSTSLHFFCCACNLKKRGLVEWLLFSYQFLDKMAMCSTLFLQQNFLSKWLPTGFELRLNGSQLATFFHCKALLVNGYGFYFVSFSQVLVLHYLFVFLFFLFCFELLLGVHFTLSQKKNFFKKYNGPTFLIYQHFSLQ